MTAILVALLGLAALVAGYLLGRRHAHHTLDDLRAALLAVPRTPDTADYRRQIAEHAAPRRPVGERFTGRVA